MEHLSDLVRWYVLSLIAAVAFAPLALWLMRDLGDRGASFVRPFAALFMVWPVWLLAGIGPGIVPFTAIWLWITIIVGGAASWYLGVRSGAVNTQAIQHLVIAELGFLAAFVLFAWLRGYGPRLTDQEKLSDLMMLSSTMRAEQMPPTDAWLAGNGINYYYGGYVIWAGLAKMIGTPPPVAFNFALISVFAMTFTSAVGLVANTVAVWSSIRTARIAGAIGGFLIVISGTLWGAIHAVTDGSTQWHLWFFEYSWDASRTVMNGAKPNITEFPSFSFLLGDLHPHLLALPYAITALGIALALTRFSSASDDQIRKYSRVSHIGRLALAAVLIGALYAINSWDFPTYLLIALVALAIGSTAWSLRQRVIGGLVLVVGSVLAWLPFYVHFETPTKPSGSLLADLTSGLPLIGGVLASVVAVDNDRTTWREYLGVIGIPWLIAIALIGVQFWRLRDCEDDPTTRWGLIGLGVVLAFVGFLLHAPVLILAGLPAVIAILLIARERQLRLETIALGLFAFGFTLTIIPELVFLLDAFGTRMNTMFKLYYQAWLLLATASALALAVLWRELKHSAVGSALVAGGLALVLVAGSAYPVLATQQWLNWRAPERGWSGWDGLAYLENDPMYAGDLLAYGWLRDNAHEDDVMLAAGGCEWSGKVSRTASATGIPTILGWDGHEGQWHLGQDGFESELVQRTSDIETLGQEVDPGLVNHYGITLIFVGANELEGAGSGDFDERDPTCAPGPFPGASHPDWPGAGWSEVYNEGGVRVYRRDGN